MLHYSKKKKAHNKNLLCATVAIVVVAIATTKGPWLVCPCSAFGLLSHHPPLYSSSSKLASSSSPSPQQEQEQPPSKSIWDPSDWKFTFNLGREPGTLMDPKWGARGERLVFDVPVSATSDKPLSSDREDPMLEKNSYRLLSPTTSEATTSTYTTDNNNNQTNRCSFAAGGEWKIQMPRGVANGKAGKFMSYLDLTTPLRKGDICLEQGDRIYLTAKCWTEQELDRALTRLRPYQKEYRYRLEKLENASSPDQTGYLRLVIDKDNALKEYQEANIYFPTIDDDDPTFDWTPNSLEWSEGPWPGETECLTIEPLFLMVRRMKFFVKEEYHVIGTWAATPILAAAAAADNDDE